MRSRETLGREEEDEGDPDTRVAKEGAGEVEEEGGGIFRALIVITPVLNKCVSMVDGGVTAGPAKAVEAMSS